MNLYSRIYVAGHRGLVGSAIVRRLVTDGATNLILRTHQELDLTNQAAVEAFFAAEQPEYVFLAAAKVGGIHANSTYPAEFIHDNLAIQTNVIHNAWKHGTKKLLFLGSSCIYPRDCPQPIKEEYLLTGPLEPTNEWYAVAKIAGLKLCQAYKRQYDFDAICAMPTNLYGPGDNFDPDNAHVVPALIRRLHEAKLAQAREVTVWGSGKPLRELLHVDDLAEALILLMGVSGETDIINIGSGEEISIAHLAHAIAQAVGYTGDLTFDKTKPDGTPRKLLDATRIRTHGWKPKIPLSEGLAATYQQFKS
ncbi:GDP-L-fucose synthase [Rhodanobacter sp. FDAARGOS 1247]|uniref:GDP-L-fucose synthase family protein n=1 Tax=Rhodanobacter sp. FDAARGOS 1247 TaxID=2778082 RepID=UPI00194DE9AD|nr:GDP-L-fucose synthase [Rhodanobacter sp. FDAARGOS 1247]QRP64729.1 GDP-L-fucose synthase [Rhodanobacter sp. FDAARGOS 1247]